MKNCGKYKAYVNAFNIIAKFLPTTLPHALILKRTESTLPPIFEFTSKFYLRYPWTTALEVVPCQHGKQKP